MIEQNPNYTQYLRQDAQEILRNLQADQKPNFGIMSPQHMVEHLSVSFKSSIKTYGEVPEMPTEKHESFKKFIFSDHPFNPSDPGKAKLEELRFKDMEEARADFVKSVDRFYSFFEENPEAKPYNDFFGALSKEELERFHYKHLRHHFKQFNLVD